MFTCFSLVSSTKEGHICRPLFRRLFFSFVKWQHLGGVGVRLLQVLRAAWDTWPRTPPPYHGGGWDGDFFFFFLNIFREWWWEQWNEWEVGREKKKKNIGFLGGRKKSWEGESLKNHGRAAWEKNIGVGRETKKEKETEYREMSLFF